MWLTCLHTMYVTSRLSGCQYGQGQAGLNSQILFVLILATTRQTPPKFGLEYFYHEANVICVFVYLSQWHVFSHNVLILSGLKIKKDTFTYFYIKMTKLHYIILKLYL